MSLSTRLLRSGARAFARSHRVPRHAFRALQTTPALTTQAETISPPSSKSPRSDEPFRFRVATNEIDWAEARAKGSKLRVQTTKLDKDNQSHKAFQAVFLRDTCCCPKCVDPSSTQKNFSTTDIPGYIRIKSVECSDMGVTLTWRNDIPGFGDDHKTFVPLSLLNAYIDAENLRASLHNNRRLCTWSKVDAQELQHFDYQSYMNNDDLLFKSLQQLDAYGFIILQGVPEDEKSVENIAERIGTIRDTFYGRTWNVKSTPQAKNVAYTQQYLGLHMDLLYMENPPGFQFLHCIKNTCEGGSSLFSDSFNTAKLLSDTKYGKELMLQKLAYHYKNDGHHYYNNHFIFENKDPASKHLNIFDLKHVNYSPPFQAPFPISPGVPVDMLRHLDALKEFTRLSEAEENLFEYRMNEGECVIFNNRRVLHGRRAFDSTSGERWLKGCYVDTDVFESRLRVLYGANTQVSSDREASAADSEVD